MSSGPQTTAELWQRLIRQPWTAPWLLSLVLHLLTLITLGVGLHLPVKQGGGVSLLASLDTGASAAAKFDGDREGPPVTIAAGSQASSNTAAPAASSLQQLLASGPPIDPTQVLPTGTAPVGANTLEGSGVGSAAAGRTGSGSRTGGGEGGGFGQGRAKTSIFGVPGEGYKFVYVFDRSGSTGGPPGRDTLTAAKAQLVASIQGLEKTHQFQIIFYNEKPLVFNPTGLPGRMVFATEQNKEMARRFILSVTSDGGTQHEEALTLAMRMQPDVIFFLTDADEPKLSAYQLEKIHRLARGITINAIEFGFGPQPEADNFMVRIAKQNFGQYGYVDVTKLFNTASRP
jgi:hypothetical protein